MNGTPRRDFVYVDDVVAGLLSALDTPVTGIYNLGTGHGYTIREVVETIAMQLGVPLIARSKEHMVRYTQALEEAGVEIRPIVGGLMTEQPFFHKYIDHQYDLPNAKTAHELGFYFGNNPEMTEEEIAYVIDVFRRTR